MVGFFILLIFLVLGIFTGLNIFIPIWLSKYLLVIIFILINFGLEGTVLKIQKRFSYLEVFTSLIMYLVFGILFTFLGEMSGINIHIAVIAVIIYSIFKNLNLIRKEIISKYKIKI